MGPLTDKYCIVGVGETPHMRPSNRTTLSMALEAVKNACADAGLDPHDIDGITSYTAMDSTSGMAIASCLGMRLNYQVDITGGGSSTEALIAHAVGLLEGGYCNTMVIFRSMNGRSGRRMGGQTPSGPMPPMPIAGPEGLRQLQGFTTPAQSFGMSCMRYMRDYGLKPEQLGAISIAHRKHALLNPKSIMSNPITMEDYLSSRWVSKPFRLLDCCLETDVAAAIIITSRERAYDLNHPPVYIMGGTARTMADNPAWNYSRDEIHYVAGFYGRDRLFGMSGVTQDDVDITSSYDAFTFTTLIQLEAYGFVPRGEAGPYVAEGNIEIDNHRPNNLSGGHLSEGYTHGISMVIENVRQLRHRADDSCPDWKKGIHTYDRSKGCRQVKNANIAACLGWGMECMSSSAMLRR
ncbi:MAG: thiolase [Chloroflexi bacterium]|nr:thiolase [Chloroflexota bacterium]